MMLHFILVSLLFFAGNALAAVPSYQIDQDKSRLQFVAIKDRKPIEGGFKHFDADIVFDPDKLDESKITVRITLASLMAESDDIASKLKLPQWLNAESFPVATFTTTTIHRLPMSDQYYADGELNLRGKKVPVVVNFNLNLNRPPLAVANGFATIQRRDFDIGQGEWQKTDVLKDEVRVEFRIVAKKQ